MSSKGSAVGGLKARGGSWSGLLFENPRVGYPISMSWAFHIELDPVKIDGESTTASLDVAWVPLGTPSWRTMKGASIACSTFAEPAEASIYTFAHHRFDTVSLSIEDQDGARLRIMVHASGDIDGLGWPSITAEAWVDFDGIYVQPDRRPATGELATELLAAYTDTTDLVAHQRGHNYILRPRETPSP